MALASDSTLCTKPRTFGICFGTPFSRTGANLVTVDDLTALSVRRIVAQQFSSATAVFAGSLIGALIVKTTVSPSGTTSANAALTAAYEPQGHLVEPEAKLGGAEPRDDLALDRVGVDRGGFCNHEQHVLRRAARPRAIFHRR